MEFDKIKVGEILQTIRKEKGQTLKDIADPELSIPTLCRIEQGYPFISLKKYELYAQKLNETLHNIIQRESSEDDHRQTLKWKLNVIEHRIDLGEKTEALNQLEEFNLDSHHLYASTISYLKGKCYTGLKKWSKGKKLLRYLK